MRYFYAGLSQDEAGGDITYFHGIAIAPDGVDCTEVVAKTVDEKTKELGAGVVLTAFNPLY